MSFARHVLADFSAQIAVGRQGRRRSTTSSTGWPAPGCLLRIDETVEPTMYRCAIVSQPELAQLRRIDDVVRMGHVRALEPGRIVLDDGTVDTDPVGAVRRLHR